MFDKMNKRHTFGFISFLLMVLAFDGSSSQSDSYTIGIERYRSNNYAKSSKWSKNNQNSDMCGGIFREKQVMIQSPNYPNAYPKNAHCEYIFYSPFVCDNEFHIQFLDFQLEPSLSCSKDKVVIGSNEAMCGQVIGIMKYKANGTLVITLSSDATVEKKGFQLVVTRLPCTANHLEGKSIDETPIAPPSVLPFTSNIPFTSNNYPKSVIPKENRTFPLQSQTVHTISKPNYGSVPETSVIKPVCLNPKSISTDIIQQNNVIATVPQTPLSPVLPSCCINVFNQRKFYLISPEFPNPLQFQNDCLYYIERPHANICRLRIEFNYFLLGDWQQSQCTHSFVEIDGRQFCGCKTGFTYYSQWGKSPKSIRFVNSPQNRGVQGFVLEVVQEECPYRLVSPFQQSNQLSTKYQQSGLPNDPRRCSYNYISWLTINTNRELLAKSICVRNIG